MILIKRAPLLALALLLTAGSALAQEDFDGVVMAGESVSVTAPYGGTIKQMSLRTGQLLSANDAVAELQTTMVLATEDGTVRGVFAAAGDSADKTVMYLQPVSKYTISASISKAYSSADTKYVRIGETLYIKCAVDGSHRALGVVTAVNGSDYTVQTTGGELYMEETVYLYRSPDYTADTRVGSGTVSRTDALPVSGTGSILRLCVSDGDEVERGQLLFETVEGELDALAPSGSVILAGADGVVAEIKVQAGDKVQKGDTLLTLYKCDEYLLRFAIPEDMLATVKAGDRAEIAFSWDEQRAHICVGQVTEISYIGEASEAGEVIYYGYISFVADSDVRIGMSATVTVTGH